MSAAAQQPSGDKRVRRFKPYPAYKDSAVEWLGEIPSHWEILKTPWLFSIGSGTTPRSDEPGYYGGKVPWVTTSELRESVVVSTEKTVTEEALRDCPSLKVHRRGSVAVAMYGATIGRLGILGIDATVNQACCVFSNPVGIDASFWFYWLQMRRLYLMSLGYGGGQPNLSQELLRSIRVPTPPLPEQRAIEAFLDRETERIDALVAKKERLIELLQEERAALITRAVTKGLDPNVPMKDSGVEWLGEIPAHWAVKSLKTVSDLQTGITLGKKFEGHALVRRPYLRVANVQDGYLALDDVADIDLPSHEVARHELRKGDVLMTEGGDFDKLGRGFVWEGQIHGCLHQNHIFAVRPHLETLSPYFLAHTMGSGYGRAYFTATSKQSTNLASTNSTKLRNLQIPLPPVAEQNNIVASLARDSGRLDSVVVKAHAGIDRLKELRAALISAAVTGKIDVREATRA